MATKRLLDIAFSLSGLIILLPLLIIIAIIIKTTSCGPVFYRSKRVGKGGKEFLMYKFRSMVNNAGELGPSITHGEDRRITGIGRFVRQTKIDELPNLINVLKGDMSLVGPRPEIPEFVKVANFRDRGVLDIRPGITGLAQLEFADETKSLRKENLDEQYSRILAKKIELDLKYKNTQNLRLDLWIILKTFKTIVLNKGVQGIC